MVKNDAGGKHKNRARKDNLPASNSQKLRVKMEEGELYAVVVKMLGGSMCHVECIDGKKRLCHFRGKFSGKNRRQNEINVNTWVMVGAREWESEKPVTGSQKDKLNQCDLIEVYSDHHKNQLMAIPKEEWHLLTTHDLSLKTGQMKDEDIMFKTDTAQEYDNLMEGFLKTGGEALSIGITDADSARAQLLIDVADI